MVRRVPVLALALGGAVALAACTTTEQATAAPSDQQVRELKQRQEKLEARISDLDTRLVQLADKVDRSMPRPPPDLQVIRVPQAQGEGEGTEPTDMDPDEGGPTGLQEDGSPPVVIKLGPSRSSGEVAALYDKARASFQAADYATAIQLFDEIIRQSPRHDLADNAVYWSGASRSELGEYLRAIDTLQQLPSKYPKSDKVPDGMYKIAEAYRALNDKVSARAYCNRVLEQYPKSEAAAQATKLLEALTAGEGAGK